MMMQFCGFLLILIITFFTGCDSVHPSVLVKFNDSAVLPCTGRCSGLVKWTVFTKPDDILVECDQSSCVSVKDGYQMNHHQYLNGDFSLTITEADFTKRAWYICNCDGRDLCDVILKVEPLISPVLVRPSDDLLMKLDIPDAVEVIYSSTGTAGRSSGQICTVNGRSAQCKPEYKERTSVTSVLELRGVNTSDSGDYIIKDVRNDEIIQTYRVSVEDLSSGGGGDKTLDQAHKPSRTRYSISECVVVETVVPGWVVPVVLFLVVVIVISLGVIVRLLRRNQSPKSGSALNRTVTTGTGAHQNVQNINTAEIIHLTSNSATENPA